MSEKQSLVTLTQGFVKIVTEASGGEVELTVIEKDLKTTKRRLCDVVNVLAGVGLVERTGKSRVRWLSSMPDDPLQPHEISVRERKLDDLIRQVDSDLMEISDSDLFQRCGWIEPQEAAECVQDHSLAVYSLCGPPTMEIQINSTDGADGDRVIQCHVEDACSGIIQLMAIRESVQPA
jgi:transcription factor E2F3